MANQPPTSVPSHPALEESAIVHDILEFVGPGAFRFMAPVNKRFREAYLTAFREKTTSYLTAVQSQDWLEICLNELEGKGRGAAIRTFVELGNRYFADGIHEGNRDHYKEAIQLFRKAIGIYKRMIPVSTRLADTYHNLSIAFSKRNQDKASRSLEFVQEAITLYKRMMPEPKSLAYAYHHLAVLQFDKGNYEASVGRLLDSIRLFEQVMPRSEQLAKVHYDLGEIQYRQGLYEACTDSFQKAIDLIMRVNPVSDLSLSAHAHRKLGNAQYHQGCYEAAIGSLQKAIRIFKRVMPPRSEYYLARACLRLKKAHQESFNQRSAKQKKRN